MIPLYAQTGLQSGNISKLVGFTQYQVSNQVQHSREIYMQFIQLKAVLFYHLFIHIHICNIQLIGYLA